MTIVSGETHGGVDEVVAEPEAMSSHGSESSMLDETASMMPCRLWLAASALGPLVYCTYHKLLPGRVRTPPPVFFFALGLGKQNGPPLKSMMPWHMAYDGHGRTHRV